MSDLQCSLLTAFYPFLSPLAAFVPHSSDRSPAFDAFLNSTLVGAPATITITPQPDEHGTPLKEVRELLSALPSRALGPPVDRRAANRSSTVPKRDFSLSTIKVEERHRCRLERGSTRPRPTSSATATVPCVSRSLRGLWDLGAHNWGLLRAGTRRGTGGC